MKNNVKTDVDFTSFFTPKLSADGAETKQFQPFSVKSIDAEKRQITAVASSEIIDRDGEIVLISAIKKAVKEYMKNPVILACHSHRLSDGRSPVVGSVVAYKFQGKDFIITVQFADTELGREYWELYKNKHQRAFSMGFRVLDRREETRNNRRVPIITEIELFEISVCAVPANPAALSKAKSFVWQKKIEAEKLRILNDDEAYIKLLDEKGDDYNVGNFEDLSEAEIALFKDLNDPGWGFDEEFFRENGLCDEIDDESGLDIGKSLDGLDAVSEARKVVRAILQGDGESLETQSGKLMFEKFKKYQDCKSHGLDPIRHSSLSSEEFKAFSRIEKYVAKQGFEHVLKEFDAAGEQETHMSFAELVGKR